jgi:hypothetical protein
MIWILAMNYDAFRAAWQRALHEAGLERLLSPPKETLDLGDMSRTYRTDLHLEPAQEARPFSVGASLTWTWDALQAARTATTEEALLMMLLGDERRHLDTEQPWLRVDLTLRASLPLDSPLPLPGEAVWRRWLADVARCLAPLLPTEVGEERRLVLSWRGEPEAQVHYASDGRLFLTGVELSAWQGIDLPRHWDDPDREPDQGPDDQLADFLEAVAEALDEWNRSLSHLLPLDRARQSGG